MELSGKLSRGGRIRKARPFRMRPWKVKTVGVLLTTTDEDCNRRRSKVHVGTGVTPVDEVLRMFGATVTTMKRIWVVVLCVGLMTLTAVLWAGEPMAALNFLVVKDHNGKPVRNAAVVLHPVNTKGNQQRGGFELKTDSEGKTNFEGVPYGKLRVQVLAPGFQTFGEDYDIEGPTMDITVRLKRPQGQYSIYEDHPNDAKKEAPKDDGKKDPGDGGGKPQ